MKISELLSRDRVAVDLKVSGKKQLIQEMAQLIVNSLNLDEHNIHIRDIVSAAMERERLGSTGVGAGVALPHARIENLDKVYAAFARLETPIDFESIDERPIDLAVLILAPTHAGSDHLKALAQISRRLRKEDVRARLRNAPNSISLYTSMIDEKAFRAA